MIVPANKIEVGMEIFLPSHGYENVKKVEFKNGLVYVTIGTFAELVFYPTMEISVRNHY